MTPLVEAAIARLSTSQRQVVNMGQGATLVIGSGGSGKSTVLTTRIARIMREEGERGIPFVALAPCELAAGQLKKGVEKIVLSKEDRKTFDPFVYTKRLKFGTFNSLFSRVMTVQGYHYGFSQRFVAFDQIAGRTDFLRESIKAVASEINEKNPDVVRWLSGMDLLQQHLIEPTDAKNYFYDSDLGAKVAQIYENYMKSMNDNEFCDGAVAIIDAFKYTQDCPFIGEFLRELYVRFVIDDFQDITPAQYRIFREISCEEYHDVIVTVNYDEITSPLAEAKFQLVEKFIEDYSPKIVRISREHQLPTELTQASENLFSHSIGRKNGSVPSVLKHDNTGNALVVNEYLSDAEEASSVASQITSHSPNSWGKLAVLGRSWEMLKLVGSDLNDKGVATSLSVRKGRFESPKFIWLKSCLELSVRTWDSELFSTMVEAANRISGMQRKAPILIAEAGVTGVSDLEFWAKIAHETGNDIEKQMGEYAWELVQSRKNWRDVLLKALEWLPTLKSSQGEMINEIAEDNSVWLKAVDDFSDDNQTDLGLRDYLDSVSSCLNNKDVEPGSVRLMTIQAAYGLQFDQIWLVGAAEGILPSARSIQPDALPFNLDSERMKFYSAIRSARKCAVVSHASEYASRKYSPSRFLDEMNIKVVEAIGDKEMATTKTEMTA